MRVEGKDTPSSSALSTLDLQPSTSRPLPAALARATRDLARDANLFLGTSSWKYEGWLGQIYDEQRYLARGKLSRKRFESECLREYADVFPSVCVDAGYYRFPAESTIAGLAGRVPEHFRLCFKVTDEITVKRFPALDRFGARAGAENPHFLDAQLFADAFLAPLAPHREKIGALIFEFSSFRPPQFARGRDFVAALDGFIGRIPRDWQYGVEVRNASLLHPDYFAVLRRHGVAHVFNSWTKMPPVSEQTAMPGAFTADFFAARFLLRPGRTYREAVSRFQPYRETGEADPAARAAIATLIRRNAAAPGARPSYVFVNNRLEGNAPNTLAASLGIAR